MNDKVLLDWAMNPDEELPTQDFDLAVAELWFAGVILRLAVDSTCPKRDFFLHCAYLIVGDAVMFSYETRTKSEVEQYLVQVKAAQHPELALLHERAIALMSDPSPFDYDYGAAVDIYKANHQMKRTEKAGMVYKRQNLILREWAETARSRCLSPTVMKCPRSHDL